MKTPKQKVALRVSLVAFSIGVFLLTLIGCAHNPYGPPHREGGFVFEQPIREPGYIKAVLQAADDWERLVGRDLFNEGAPVYVLQQPGPVEYGKGGKGDAVAYRRARTIVLSTSAEPARFYPIVAHELGHLIGLDHSENPADVMAPTVKSGHVISVNDASRARQAIGVL